jgi:hypothetical protein
LTIGEKFRAAPGIAAPVNVEALALQPIEFTKRIAAAANTVNVSCRMGSPIRVSDCSHGVASISLSIFLNYRPSAGIRFSQKALKIFRVRC